MTLLRYSGDHVHKLLKFAASNGKPFLLLMPNYVYTKSFYNPTVPPGMMYACTHTHTAVPNAHQHHWACFALVGGGGALTTVRHTRAQIHLPAQAIRVPHPQGL